ncbi:MAG: hypothetical protein ABF449_02855 [Ethanoligenens sp.]
MAIFKARLHTGGKTDEQIRKTNEIGELTAVDIENQKRFWNLLDGMEVYVLPWSASFNDGKYAYIGRVHDEDADREKQAFWLMEQDSLFGCFVDQPEEFERVWESGEYVNLSDASINFDAEDVEILEEVHSHA